MKKKRKNLPPNVKLEPSTLKPVHRLPSQFKDNSMMTDKQRKELADRMFLALQMFDTTMKELIDGLFLVSQMSGTTMTEEDEGPSKMTNEQRMLIDEIVARTIKRYDEEPLGSTVKY